MSRYAVAATVSLALSFSWPAGPAASATVVQRHLPPATGQAGSLARDYKVAVPDGLQAGTPVPVVMVLHGCLQSDANMVNETRFVELAEREGFIAVFPFITDWVRTEQRTDRCWGFWFDQHQHESRGEPGDLRRILAAVESEFTIDPDRRYVAGLSSGAAMAVVMAVAYSEDFAAAGAVAGLPYDEDACAVANACFGVGLRFKTVNSLLASMTAEQNRTDEQRLVPLMAIHSRNDGTVPFRNAQNMRDVWIARYGASTQGEESDCSREGVRCDHSTFRDGAGRSVVETAFYDGPPFVKSHAWIGDNAGPFADPTGPSATDLLWAFFEANPRNAGPATQISFNEPAINGRNATVSGTVNSETGVDGVFVRLDGAAPQGEKPAGATEAWSVSFDDLPDNQRYVPVARVVLADGSERSAVGPAFTLGSPLLHASDTFPNHIIAGRITVQQPPCTAGFGVCDADFNSLFFRFGMNPFELHAANAAGPWFVDPTRVTN